MVYRIANQLMTLSSFVTAPFELVIAIAFLYQVLGWTAVAGLGIMALSLPINHVLVKRRILVSCVVVVYFIFVSSNIDLTLPLQLHRTVLSSRDKRMDVLNEFIQSIRFVKFSGSENLGSSEFRMHEKRNSPGFFAPDLIRSLSILFGTLRQMLFPSLRLPSLPKYLERN